MIQFVLYSLVLLFSMNSWALNFQCPQKGEKFDLDQTYSALKEGTIWNKAGLNQDQTMAFVNQFDDLYVAPGSLSPLGQTYLNSSGELDTRGSFKVGYSMPAKECRRKITLVEETSPGSGEWNGFTDVDICAPAVAEVFYQLKTSDFQQIATQLTQMAAKLNAAAVALVDAIDKCEDKGNDDCEPLRVQKSSLYWKGQSLLKIANLPDEGVEYFRDEQGILLPRFRAKIEKLWFERKSIFNFSSKQRMNACRFTVVHQVQSYGGLIKEYEWELHYEGTQSSTFWYFDTDTGESKESQVPYDTPPLNFIDTHKRFPMS